MKIPSSLLVVTLVLASFVSALADSTDMKQTQAGTIYGLRPDRAIGFHGAPPSPQRAGSAQAAVSATVGAAVATTAATSTTPFGYSQAQADALVARVNQLRADVLALTVLNNELRAALTAKGLIKGAP